MSLTVKAFLKKPGPGPAPQHEIRRFAVDTDVSTSFVYLQQKIGVVFPSLANKAFALFWKDSENDLIAFSSDDELTEALINVTDGVFKIYIEEKEGTERQENGEPDGGAFHPLVTCDGCSGPVCGTRYKCQVCPDYDLCSKCKGKGLHPEHQMSAIEHPFLQQFFSGSCSGAGRSFPGPPPCFYPPPQMPGGMPAPPPPQFPFFNANPANRDEMRMQRRAWRRWMKSACGANPCKMWKKERKDEKKEEKRQEKKTRKAEKKAMREKERAEKGEGTQAEAPQVEKESSSSSSSSDEGESSPTGNYLHGIGQSVAAMLDPLGIDVEIDVEHKGKRKHCHRGGGFSGGPWGWHARAGFGGHGWGRGRGGFCHPGGPFHGFGWSEAAASATAAAAAAGGQPSTSQGPPPPPPHAHFAHHFQAPHYPAPHYAPPQYQQPPDVDTNSETGEMRSGFQTPRCDATSEPAPAKSDQGTKAASGSPVPNGWTIVADGDEAEVEDAARGVEKLRMSGPDASDNAQPPSMDPRLPEALDNMMSMGYDDNDGWLTAHLVDNNYDIGRTIDAINSKK